MKTINRRLLLGCLRDGGAVVHIHVAGSGVPCSPVRVGIILHRRKFRGALKADKSMMKEVHQDTLVGSYELVGSASHCAGQHADGVCDIRARLLHRAVQ
eukprot:732203-Pleurochrysis_carterae.AAC.2